MPTKEQNSALDPASQEVDDEYTERVFDLLPDFNGYAETFSVFPGEMVTIRAARKPVTGIRALLPRRREAFIDSVEIRDPVRDAIVATQVPPGRPKIFEQMPANYRDEGANYTCSVAVDTTDLAPALYEAVLRDSAGRTSQDIYFNVKPRDYKGYDIVCVLPTFTWQAYNRVAGGSFYTVSMGPKRAVSTQRPISRKRDNYIEAALPFLAAFHDDGAKICCIDSLDLHRATYPQGKVPVMALLTHDEYWTVPMRAEVDLYVRRRGNLLVLAGNVCWWRAGVDGNNVIVDKTPGRNTGNLWSHTDPEERTFVSSFRFGGYALPHAKGKSYLQQHISHLSDRDRHHAGGIDVVMPDHPIFEGVALGRGNRFGEHVPVLHREVDGVPLKPDGSVDRNWYDADEIEPTIIATGLVVGRLRYEAINRVGVVVEADIGRGHVVNMGSFGWSLGLVNGDEAVKQVVLNAYRYCRGIAAERRGRFARAQ